MPYLRLFFLASLLATTGVASTGCRAVAATELAFADMLINNRQEAQLGAEYATQIEGEIPPMGDPVLDEFVSEIGHLLVQHSPPAGVEFNFKVTADPSVNAFAIPGGFCYVNAGLILAAENEAELAAVIGHEINHVTRRHGVRSIVRAVGFEQAGSLIDAAGGKGAGKLVSGTGGVLGVRRFGREDEREADRYGVEAMYKAGYDPRAGATFFEKLFRLSGSKDPGLAGTIMSTHPPSMERVENIQRQVEQYDLSRPMILNTERFPQMQARTRQLMQDRER